MKRFLVWTLRAIGGLLFLFALGLGGGYLWLRGSLPKTEGTIEIAGLEATVEVLRDADGLVTIRARGERDAARALGYVHAQDRLWQMDLMRRIGAGRQGSGAYHRNWNSGGSGPPGSARKALTPAA